MAIASAQTPVRQNGFNRFADAVDTVSLGSNVTTGNLVVVTIAIRSDNAAVAISSVATASTTLTHAVTLEHSDGGLHCTSSIYYAIATGTSPTATVTLAGNWASTTSCISIFEFSGNAAASPLDDTSSGQTDGDTSFNSGNVDTTVADGVLVGVSVSNDPVTFTTDTDFTEVTDDSGFTTAGYDLVGATGTYNMVNTADDFVNGTTCLAAFKPSVGGGGGRTSKNTRPWPLGMEIGMQSGVGGV
jgi:hypothetical protein